MCWIKVSTCGGFRLGFVKKGFDWLINEEEKEPPPPNSARTIHVMKMIQFSLFLSQHPQIQQQNTIKEKPSQPIWRPGSLSLSLSLSVVGWPKTGCPSNLVFTWPHPPPFRSQPPGTLLTLYLWDPPLLFTPPPSTLFFYLWSLQSYNYIPL